MDVVTGAFSYTGRYIAAHLLSRGRRVRTLSRNPEPAHPLGSRVETRPLDFSDVGRLRASLDGAETLYNTYWIRFPHGGATYERAIANTLVLAEAARAAGVRRLVHLSVSNASEDSPLPYFRGKAVLERKLRSSGLSVAIVRPTLIFGSEDLLVNNIAWLLRRLPLFVVAGWARYAVQPVAAADVAAIAVEAAESDDEVVVDAAGPDVLTYQELVRAVARVVESKARIVRASPHVTLFLGSLVGRLRRDVILTREELAGLMASLLVSHGPVTGHTRFVDWLEANGPVLGREYVSELARNYRAPL